MQVPGSNILNVAMRAIARQNFKYYPYISRETNSIGYDVNSFAPPVNIQGSIQPVARNMYEQWGLDLQKNYITVYTPNRLIDVDRDRSSDQILFSGKTYQVISNTRWFPLDGWVAAICVEVPNKGQCC